MLPAQQIVERSYLANNTSSLDFGTAGALSLLIRRLDGDLVVLDSAHDWTVESQTSAGSCLRSRIVLIGRRRTGHGTR